ncbi:nucleoside triphosphate pyrophosphatase [Desulfonatronum sp. SC1]|uniref:Maf family protein n=1 Tax=Desulfonatronum sp. SC1 TaxID=2109626 RepID=UPI000D2F86FA|nr:Maf family protein [Desulfonatronum sp. SC1]PTN32169.1 septum formation protein Maf [Desulfonatronum sp. SC1]
MFRTLTPLVLASGSPRRKELLANLGLDFSIHPALTPEPAFTPGTDPEAFALDAAKAKAREVAALQPEAVVLAADTIVVLDGDVLGKPVDSGEALAMLERLAGREHVVITGCCLLDPKNDDEQHFAVRTTVWMQNFGPEVLAAYVATGEPMDKAGAYGIQERAALLVDRIQGSYTNVVGLPLAEVVQRLLNRSIITPHRP